MQTFVPYADATLSARVLDRQRLGKQRVECLQLIRTLTGVTKGWSNHPASRMWANNIGALAQYAYAVCREWKSRGYVDNCAIQIEMLVPETVDQTPPAWLFDPAVHISHRSNLLRKMPEHYRQYWPNLPNDLPYVWPV